MFNDFEMFDMDESPWWYYSQLSETTRSALAAENPALLRCLCGGVVTAAKISASGADDGPAYLFCNACYRAELENDRDQGMPLAEDARSIEIYDIVWH